MIAQFVAEVFEMLLGEASFEEGSRVDARRGVALEVDEVARLIPVAAMKEMIEADFDSVASEA